MHSNSKLLNKLYDDFFLQNTFNTQIAFETGQKEVDWIKNKIYLSETSRILDVGCGPGRHLKYLSKISHLTYGIDISTSCVKIARKNCADIKDNITLNDFAKFAEKSINERATYNLVLCTGATIGYSSSKEENIKSLKNLASLLNTINGYLVISFLNRAWATQKYNEPHTQTAEKNGFTVIDSRYIKNNYLFSERIYKSIESNDVPLKYSDQVYLYTPEEIIEIVSIKNYRLYSSYSDQAYDPSLPSALPVLIFSTGD